MMVLTDADTATVERLRGLGPDLWSDDDIRAAWALVTRHPWLRDHMIKNTLTEWETSQVERLTRIGFSAWTPEDIRLSGLLSFGRPWVNDLLLPT